MMAKQRSLVWPGFLQWSHLSHDRELVGPLWLNEGMREVGWYPLAAKAVASIVGVRADAKACCFSSWVTME